MRRCLSCILAAAIAAGLLAAAVALSGLVSVGASTGHWDLTSWVLHTAMRRSVDTHAPSDAPVDLADPALARRAAGHFATGCAHCHGAPGRAADAYARSMTPTPPELAGVVPGWSDGELFWIVRHGVKMTAMPAWPALEREDEVWAMVAFLRRLPGMDAATYAEFSGAPAAGCERCHGEDGAGSAAFPRLAGQNEAYLLASLVAYAEGGRASGIMEQAVSGLDGATLAALARHYAAADAPVDGTPGPEPGERLAREGDPASGVPACASCHGLAEGPRFASYPVLAGQEAWYLELQLRLLRDGERGGTAFAPIMHAVASRLDDDQIAAAAAFYAGLAPAR